MSAAVSAPSIRPPWILEARMRRLPINSPPLCLTSMTLIEAPTPVRKSSRDERVGFSLHYGLQVRFGISSAATRKNARGEIAGTINSRPMRWAPAVSLIMH